MGWGAHGNPVFRNLHGVSRTTQVVYPACAGADVASGPESCAGDGHALRQSLEFSPDHFRVVEAHLQLPVDDELDGARHLLTESGRVERQPVLAREAGNRLALLQPVSHRQIPGLRFSFLTSSESVNASVGWPSASVTSVILGGGRETGR
jgi:hypothetical protein